jgi:hypothetical protein
MPAPTGDCNGSAAARAARNVTECLSAQQERAVALLLTGASVTAVAASIGVSRETLHRWKRENFEFVAAFNRGRREIREAASLRLQVAWSKAAENIAAAIDSGDLKASMLLFRVFAVTTDAADAIGSDDAKRLAEDAELAAAEARELASVRRLITII